MALQTASKNEFLRSQAIDALAFGIAQKEALAYLYLIEEGPKRGALYIACRTSERCVN